MPARDNLPVGPQTLTCKRPGLVLAPLAPGDEDALRRIIGTAEVRRWWDAAPDDFPWDDPKSTRLTIRVEGAVVGLIQFWEETEPKYRHAAIDLFLDPALHRRGIGTDALRCLVHHLIEDRGHHRITIDPAADNAAAIRRRLATWFVASRDLGRLPTELEAAFVETRTPERLA